MFYLLKPDHKDATQEYQVSAFFFRWKFINIGCSGGTWTKNLGVPI